MTVTITSQGHDTLLQTIDNGRVQFLVDIEPELGGRGEAPVPFELLFGAWGSCTNMTLQVYCRRKGWPLHRVETVFQEGEEAASPGAAAIIQRVIRLWGELSTAQVTQLTRVAEKCPVHLFLMKQAQSHRVVSHIELVTACEERV